MAKKFKQLIEEIGEISENSSFFLSATTGAPRFYGYPNGDAAALDSGMHSMNDPTKAGILQKFNAYIGSISEKQWVDPESAIVHMRERLNRFGMDFSKDTQESYEFSEEEGGGYQFMEKFVLTQFGGRYGFLNDSDGFVSEDDGISNRMGEKLCMVIEYRLEDNYQYSVRARILPENQYNEEFDFVTEEDGDLEEETQQLDEGIFRSIADMIRRKDKIKLPMFVKAGDEKELAMLTRAIGTLLHEAVSFIVVDETSVSDPESDRYSHLRSDRRRTSGAMGVIYRGREPNQKQLDNLLLKRPATISMKGISSLGDLMDI